MNKDQLKQLFKEKIIPHQRLPYHFERCEKCHYEIMAYNPFCGDKYRIQLNQIDPVEQAYFQGMGCAISKASTSILLQRIEGMTANEIINFCQQFLDALAWGKTNLDKELDVLITLKNFDGRVDCIALPWKALLEFFVDNPSTNDLVEV